MRQIREILRQKWGLGQSHRAVAESLRISNGTVGTTVLRARAAGLDWAQVEGLTDEVLEARVYGPPTPPTHHRVVPDCAYLHVERRKPGVTLELLHLEYLEQHPDGYRYTQFCEFYRRWCKRRGRSMRQVHRAGEKCFVDYAGTQPSIIDAATGEGIPVQLFVAVLGASNYTYAEATRTQQVADWIASHQRAFQYFGGVTTALVPDQLKSGVTLPCRYEPGLQKTYEEFARFAGTVVLPARPGKPRDKAKVEAGVLVVTRWILARLRHERFFSLAALNTRIAELLEVLNTRPMRLYRASRRELFERLDRPALRPLPAEAFIVGEWHYDARVNIDYHVELHGHYYSVPYPLSHELVDARLTGTTVELFHRGPRVATHVRSHLRGRHTTDPAHMPKAHQHHLLPAVSALIVTMNSRPIRRSEPDRSLGRIFVPRRWRFQTSGGTAPTSRSVFGLAAGTGSASGTGLGSGAAMDPRPGWGLGPGSGGAPVLSAFAESFLNRNTPASKATSSGAINSSNHTRS